MIQAGDRTTKPGMMALVGLALGLAGAVLDFYSSYEIMSYPAATMGMALGVAVSGAIWMAGLVALGVLLVATAVASFSSFGASRMALFGGMMVVYGVVMLLVGATMDAGISPAMQTASFTGLGMLVVGAAMVANGSMMLRSGSAPVSGSGSSASPERGEGH
jgi:hypothetical protein